MVDDQQRVEGRNSRHPLALIGGLLLIGAAVALLFLGGSLLAPDGTDRSILEQIPAFDTRPGGDSASDGPLQVGDPAREFVLNDVDGHPVRLSDLNGRPVILNFWATWCAPCRIEMPDLQAMYDEYQADGLAILAIDRAESAETVRSFFTMSLT